jgi:hypothetical protein
MFRDDRSLKSECVRIFRDIRLWRISLVVSWNQGDCDVNDPAPIYQLRGIRYFGNTSLQNSQE